jgi:hypothetical protein
MYQMSEKLSRYLVKVMLETGRKILIQQADYIGITGMGGTCLVEDDELIVLRISPDLDNAYSFEASIAHAAGLGLFRYSRGYCNLKPRRILTQGESDSLVILVAMIQDIAVNKTVQENGVEFYDPDYPEVVGLETEAMLKKQDIYETIRDPTYKKRFMIYRYIQVWGFLHYCELEENLRGILKKFEADFRLYRPRQYKEAAKIKEIILRNDVFTAEGERRIVEAVLRLWGLEGVASVETYLKGSG